MDKEIRSIFDFLDIAERLKSTYRNIKKRCGNKESTADHSWRMVLMVIILKDKFTKKLDYVRCIEIAAVHDLVEAIAGDTNYQDVYDGKISKSEKKTMEENAIVKISDSLNKKLCDKIQGLWGEYEDSGTDEAMFIKALDKIECITQLAEAGHKTYERPELIACYADSATKKFPELIPYLKEAKRRLKLEFIKGNHKWKEEYNFGLK